MISQILQLILGIVVFFCSAPKGMANETVSEEARADVFVSEEILDDDEQAVLTFDEAALISFAECSETTEDSVDSENDGKRIQKRTPAQKTIISKCRFHNFLSLKLQAKGVSKHPLTQDAGQERTAAIRFLQISALI